jgi:cytoskeleton protein RodZ
MSTELHADSSDPSVPVAETLGPPSPGGIIRRARTRARLSLEDLSSQTKLARNTLDALERDDFDALLEPVYVRGYYRKCAKVLDLPEQELLDAYHARVTPRAPAAPSKLRLASGTELSSSTRPPWTAAVLLGLAAVLLSVGIWLMRGQPGLVVPPPVETAEQNLPAASEPAALEPGSTEPLPAVPGQTDPAAALPAPEVAVEPPPPPPPQGRLTMEFTETSWAEVQDANGSMLLQGLIEAGRSSVFDAPIPYTVFLGNAPGVRVHYDDQPVSLRAYTRADLTARFKLPQVMPTRPAAN